MNKVVSYNDNSSYGILLHEYNDDYRAVEEKIIADLSKFTDSSFDTKTWVQVIEKKSVDKKAHFGALNRLDDRFLRVVRLWVILKSNARGELYTLGHHLSHFTKYIAIKNLNFKNIRVNEIKGFEEYLDNLKKKDGGEYSIRSKESYYKEMSSFFTVMQAHPLVAKIDNISIFINPYATSHNLEIKNIDKEIPQEKLDIMDAYFRKERVPLILRVWYWLMRMYGARPEDVMNYPLDCVKMFNKEEQLATMKTYVGKQGGATHRINSIEERPYKIEFLNLKEPTQKMLYNLILEQQEYAVKLQNGVRQKNFLMSREGYNKRNKHTIVSVPVHSWFNTQWRERLKTLFIDGKYPEKKALKHTALIKRQFSGIFNRWGLKSVANHKSDSALDSYVGKHSSQRAIDLQKDIENFNMNTNIAWEYKGQSVNNLQNIIAKIKDDPLNHQLPDLGFCPDASRCGNHFECVGCEYLVPHPELKEYYLDQAEEYRYRAKKLKEIGKEHLYRDRMIVASKFFNLYLRSMDEEYKKLSGFKMMDMKEIFSHGQ